MPTYVSAPWPPQVCFKELVTISHDNSLELVRDVKGQHWIGLREKLGADPWSGWANGDPITFQNWYHGKQQPVVETTTAITAVPKTSTSGFTQTASDDSLNTSLTITAVPEMSGFTQTASDDSLNTSLTITAVPEMSGFTQTAYDDRFYGSVSVDRNTVNATLSWLSAPGNITSYRVEVQGPVNLNENVTGLTYDLFNVTPGTHYAVRVFPLKCDRELNSQNISFFTKPETPQNPTVFNITESSVALRWDRPAGNLQSYCVKVWGGPCQNTSEEQATVSGLISGGCYTLVVLSAAGDMWSEVANITVGTSESADGRVTQGRRGNGPVRPRPLIESEGEPPESPHHRPSNVTNLVVSEVTNQSLKLSWSHSGNATGYRVTAVDINNATGFRKTVNVSAKQVQVTQVRPGTHLQLTVWALNNLKLEGHGVTTESFIAPDPVPSLYLTSSANSIQASWPPPNGSYQFFHVSVQLKNSNDTPTHENTNSTSLTLYNLFAVAEYEVTVSTHAGNLESDPVVNSTYTIPVMPEDLTISHANASTATLKWRTPNAAPTTKYLVRYNASFWNHADKASLHGGPDSSLTVGGLRPGSLYVFEVLSMSGDQQSSPGRLEHFTPGNKSAVTLSMMCSSVQPLICEENATKEDVLKELKTRFGVVLHGVSWNITWKER
ncbi:unnamed protein product [Lota lota]